MPKNVIHLVCDGQVSCRENLACLSLEDWSQFFGEQTRVEYAFIKEVIVPLYPNPEVEPGRLGMCAIFRRSLKIAFQDSLKVLKVEHPEVFLSQVPAINLKIRSFLRLKQLRRLRAEACLGSIMGQIGSVMLSPQLEYIVKIKGSHYKIQSDNHVLLCQLSPDVLINLKPLDDRGFLKVIGGTDLSYRVSAEEPSGNDGNLSGGSDRRERASFSDLAKLALETIDRIDQRNQRNQALWAGSGGHHVVIDHQSGGEFGDYDDEDSVEYLVPPSLPDPVSLGIGGLNEEFADIFRRAFVTRTRSTREIHAMGLKHCRGIILHGPAGTGKTLIARKIAEMLQASAPPKIVSAAGLLNKYVGESESKVRELFADADKDPKGFYVIIIDEIDAVFKTRGGSNNSSVGDSMVNQLLTKMDGLETNDNFLVVAMTNRLDMLDPAMLRPGRFGVQIQIGLPDAAGRLDILKIHTTRMNLDDSVDLAELSNQTVNFSGAELEGLVRTAATWAIQESNDARAAKVMSSETEKGKGDEKKNEQTERSEKGSIVLREGHFDRALKEVNPRFGRKYRSRKMKSEHLIWSEELAGLEDDLRSIIRYSMNRPLTVVMVSGPSRSGKSTLVDRLIREADADFVREVGSREMVGLSDAAKIDLLTTTFNDAYRSATSIVLLDDLELMVELVGETGIVHYSPRLTFNLQMLLKQEPEDCHLLVVLTSAKVKLLQQIGLASSGLIDHLVEMPLVEEDQVEKVVKCVVDEENCESDSISGELKNKLVKRGPYPIGKLLQLIEYHQSK